MRLLKNKLFTLYMEMMKLLLKVVPVKRGQICIINGSGYAGSNGLALFRYLKEELHYKDVWLLENFPSSHLKLAIWLKLASSQVIIGTHDPYKVSKRQTYIQLWHGIPLKRMGFLAKNANIIDLEKGHQHWSKSVDYITSSSDMYDTLMSACEGIADNKFVHLGFPRNDFFQIDEQQKAERKLELVGLFDQAVIKKEPRLLFYLPTFRMEDNNQNLSDMLKNGNIFGLTNFESNQFEALLARENIIIIAKLHPVEEKQVDVTALNQLKHVKVIKGNWLQTNQHDLYEYLAVTDALMTDYSSVYFDYLLMDKPLLFLANDLKNYEARRGFLLTPYQTFAPGLVAKSMQEFNQALVDLFKLDLHDERNQIRKMIYQDTYLKNNSSEQIWKQLIQDLVQDCK
ncbi:CDP-glycerol glycerophosphotransferase family protein [Latilactobacillus fuchuensis]|uniref:CDP-glycerol:poly(Glycerophosphate) glycerophosphotransferase n=2 Tax=Latilactobacillus fuchuensis TaxID=164393 RepID=A0A2N9DXB4_9LACO|nr:CDP-glycerol glycerophosphotransferase family protein [Latilactobacillus fuchuensis]KRL59037.1 teichoic acid biosynthesis protein [Latilactobacillus fuchuensis DSM 14340 = JCM 11249]SPC39311.1 conserved hypothetical protein [Latilactobacillus fuchuensis]